MITCLSKYVSRFLCNKHIINSDEVDIYQYGFEIIISTVAGMIISLVVGVIFQLFYISLVYYTIFVTVRQFTGGYHAKTYLECNIVFSIVSFSTIGLTKLILKLSIYHIDIHFILLCFASFVIMHFAPIDHPNKRLNDEQKQINKHRSIFLTIILLVLSCFLYPIAIDVSIAIALTLCSIAALMVIAIKNKRVERNEENN